MVQNIHHLVPTKLQFVELHRHRHRHHQNDQNQTAVSPLILKDIDVANLNLEVGQVTTPIANSVSVRKWLKLDTRQQA